MRRGGWLAGLLVSGLLATAARAEPVTIYAAGSLGAVLPQIIEAAGLAADAAPPVFGPAGLLRQRLQAGEHADLFLSADMAQPRALATAANVLVLPFARNRMCVLAPARLGLTADNLLDRMLSPGLRLATSTAGADPAGDYTLALFAKADRIHPGAGAALKAKAMPLLGGPASMTPQPGHSAAATIFLGNHADALIYYCSGAAAAAAEMPGLVSLPVPDALEVGPIYGMAVLSNQPQAARLALFILSGQGQALMAKAGLLPLVGQ